MKTDSTQEPPEEQKGQEWKVLLVLVLIIVGLEGVFRGLETRLSADVRHLRSLPELAGQIRSRGAREETTLIVGNSLARRGIDQEKLKTGLQSAARAETSVFVDFFVPDASSVTEWSWGLRRYFGNEGIDLRRIIVITGKRHLLDRPGDPETLGAYFVGRGDLPDALKATGSHEDAIRLFLGNLSHTAANRDRIRPLVGYRFLPGFEEAWPRLIVAGYEATMDRLGESAGLWELNSLRRLLDQAAELKAELLVVAVPLPETYQLPENLAQFLADENVTIIDLSTIPGVNDANFPDGYHLDREGAATFTEALLRFLQ